MALANIGRRLAYHAFRDVLGEVYGARVTEREFRDRWLDVMRSYPRLTANGWYDPPPDGLTILFATDAAPGRVSFHSLRRQESWPSDATMDWDHGLLFAYCSPVDTKTGLVGDFQTTLYYGDDPAVLAHYRTAYAATHAVLSCIDATMTSGALFHRSREIFAAHGVYNAVASVTTDVVELDLGMSLPVIPPAELPADEILTPALRDRISNARRFINAATDWPLAAARQVSVEPQLRSVTDPTLPQISFHYAAAFGDEELRILDECDDLLRDMHLIES